jgi:N-formylglutamate amidohydrolase
MTLPLLLSVPHAGLTIPPEVEDLCVLTTKEIIEDSDEGASEIYLPLQREVSALVTTVVARAIVDMNRSEDDRRKDGIIKTHTCWNAQIYSEFPSHERITTVIETFYKPYHARLTEYARTAKLGVDCHTMGAHGPPVGPDPGKERPAICMSNAESTCPLEWITSLAACFEEVFEKEVSINTPFKGGFIISSHAKELPWVQLELARDPSVANKEKSIRVFKALEKWCKITWS